MKVFDFNVHLPFCTSPSSFLDEELSMSVDMLVSSLHHYSSAINEYCFGANFMIFSQLLSLPDIRRFKEEAMSILPNSKVTLLLDIHRDPDINMMSDLKCNGVDAIKFHSYVQSISTSLIPQAVQHAINAAALDMPVFVDASYGSLYMYDYDNLQLIAEIMKVVRSSPVIVLHSGGSRVLEAFLLADCQQNVFLDTSFSISYYQESPVLDNASFAYKRLGADRILYGSDSPYISFHDSLADLSKFCTKYSFDSSFTEHILTQSYKNVFPGA